MRPPISARSASTPASLTCVHWPSSPSGSSSSSRKKLLSYSTPSRRYGKRRTSPIFISPLGKSGTVPRRRKPSSEVATKLRERRKKVSWSDSGLTSSPASIVSTSSIAFSVSVFSSSGFFGFEGVVGCSCAPGCVSSFGGSCGSSCATAGAANAYRQTPSAAPLSLQRGFLIGLPCRTPSRRLPSGGSARLAPARQRRTRVRCVLDRVVVLDRREQRPVEVRGARELRDVAVLVESDCLALVHVHRGLVADVHLAEALRALVVEAQAAVVVPRAAVLRRRLERDLHAADDHADHVVAHGLFAPVVDALAVADVQRPRLGAELDVVVVAPHLAERASHALEDDPVAGAHAREAAGVLQDERCVVGVGRLDLERDPLDDDLRRGAGAEHDAPSLRVGLTEAQRRGTDERDGRAVLVLDGQTRTLRDADDVARGELRGGADARRLAFAPHGRDARGVAGPRGLLLGAVRSGEERGAHHARPDQPSQSGPHPRLPVRAPSAPARSRRRPRRPGTGPPPGVSNGIELEESGNNGVALSSSSAWRRRNRTFDVFSGHRQLGSPLTEIPDRKS